MDADYNQHLAAAFGAKNSDIPALSDDHDNLVNHVIGRRRDVTAATFNKAMLPNDQSNLIGLDAEDVYLSSFIKKVAPQVHLMRVGEFNAADKGIRCYHVRTAAADILLSHLKPLDKSRTLVVDFTAGVDPFASPIYLKLDALVLAVEPTLKGAEVAKQWRSLLADAPVPLFIVANKITDADDVTWLKKTITPDIVQAVIQVDPAIRRMERGDILGWSDLLAENKQSLLELWEKIALSRSAQNDNRRQEFLMAMAEKRLLQQK